MVPPIAQIVPFRVGFGDQLLLPCAAPMLDPLLHGDRFSDGSVLFEPNQLVVQELIGERSRVHALRVLQRAFHQVAGNARVQRGVVLVGHDVHPAAFHRVKIACCGQ